MTPPDRAADDAGFRPFFYKCRRARYFVGNITLPSGGLPRMYRFPFRAFYLSNSHHFASAYACACRGTRRHHRFRSCFSRANRFTEIASGLSGQWRKSSFQFRSPPPRWFRARQIEAGRGADIFNLRADLDWMTISISAGFYRSCLAHHLFGNIPVLIAPRRSSRGEPSPSRHISIFPASLLGGRNCGRGDPEPRVPAGKYGRSARHRLGVWSGVVDHSGGA